MNESDFENELRALRLPAPSAGLTHGVAREISGTGWKTCAPRAGRLPGRVARLRPVLARLCWASGGAAVAAVALVSFLVANPAALSRALTASSQNGERTPASLQSVGSAREMITEEDGGLLWSEGNELAQLVRYSSIERHAWANPTTGAWVEVEVPREDVVLLPVAFQ